MAVLSTLASGSGHQGQAPPGKKAGRLLIGVLHGSSTGGVSRSKGTLLPQLIKFIDHEKEDVVRLCGAGVGTNGGFFDKIAAALGIGLNKIVVMLYKDIAENYRQETLNRERDRIILIGFSRGGDAEIKVAKLINAVGLVIDGNDKIYRALYELLANEGEWSEKAINEVKAGYEWIPGVKIAELLVFDAVSTLGVPATGIGRVLKVLPAWSKNNDHMIVVPPNVQHTSAVIILHDPRATHEHSTLCIPEGSDQVLRQKYYHGRHSDSMNIGPMSYQVQNLARDLNLAFVPAHLDAYFPGPSAKKIPDWVFSTIKPVNPKVLAILGNKPRMPGRNTRSGFVTNEEVSSSLRHRGYGVTDLDKPVEGFYLSTDPTTGRHTWVQNSTNRSKKSNGSGSDQDGSSVVLRLPESVDGDFERQLSGLPANG